MQAVFLFVAVVGMVAAVVTGDLVEDVFSAPEETAGSQEVQLHRSKKASYVSVR